MAGLDLTGLLRDHASRHSVPGAAIGVLRDDATAYAYHGIADVRTGEAVTAETRFAVGSLAKSMVATALTRLVAGRRLSLDAPAAAHVPELRGSAWGERATIRDLLANRSQIPLSRELEFAGLDYEDDDVLSRVAAKVATDEPTANIWSYTNAGWSVLGRALETLTGLTWEEAMHAHLLVPFGMDRTTFANLPVGEPRASGHEVTAEGVVTVDPWTPRSLGPAGTTLLSTLPDVLRFARRQLEDASLAMLRTPHAEVGIYGWLDAWCLGCARFDWDGGPVWGWDGLIRGQRTILRLVPERGAIALLSNCGTGRALYRSLFPELMETFFGVRMPPLLLEPVPDGPAGDLSRYAGLYAWPDLRLEVTATETGLVIAGQEGAVEASPLDDRVFLVDAHDPDTPTVTFGAFDHDGRPHALYQMLWALPRV